MNPMIAVHCDWSVDPRKRWMASSVRENGVWHLNPPEPVGATIALFDRLRASAKSASTLVVGFDFPIGLPVAYGKLTESPDFRSFLSFLGADDWSDWFSVCAKADEISTRRPFYPKRPGGTKRVHLSAALGISGAELLRRCEHATSLRPAACSIFWTLGCNQVGKGAISGWREVLQPNLARIAIWPFEGPLKDLVQSREIIVVETYPGEVYSQIGLPAKKLWSKRSRAGRRTAGVGLTRWIEDRPVTTANGLLDSIEAGFSDSSVGEDQFDAVVGLFGMIDVLDGRRPAAPADLDDETTRWEGWILGQAS